MYFLRTAFDSNKTLIGLSISEHDWHGLKPRLILIHLQYFQPPAIHNNIPYHILALIALYLRLSEFKHPQIDLVSFVCPINLLHRVTRSKNINNILAFFQLFWNLFDTIRWWNSIYISYFHLVLGQSASLIKTKCSHSWRLDSFLWLCPYYSFSA